MSLMATKPPSGGYLYARATRCSPSPTCSPNGHNDPRDGLEEGQEAEGQQVCWRSQQLILVGGLEQPLGQQGPITADLPSVVPGTCIQRGC
ncbi:hypothetical protein P7K49_036921 [Saguinus oedipus]|uniref:Uncharacterized protein n=1 Tax=Saguinus oedipus TaxID=9490 RepID=A0ABQ9TLI3_SAGOE|nr:hypothetical protein P7K49_036921 [Saguinus oedipus]